MPVVIDSKNQSIPSYLENVADIVFQFVANWIADDFSEEIEGIKFDEISNNFSDYITEFFVHFYQYGDDYKLLITHSNKYSDKMLEEFKYIHYNIN